VTRSRHRGRTLPINSLETLHLVRRIVRLTRSRIDLPRLNAEANLEGKTVELLAILNLDNTNGVADSGQLLLCDLHGHGISVLKVQVGENLPVTVLAVDNL
jgi:hypothetical protein